MVPISMLLTFAGTYLPLTSPCITLTLTSPCITRANPSWKATMDHGPLLRASWLRGRLQCPLVVPLKSWWRKRSCHCHPGKATRRGRDLYYNVEHEPARRMPGWPTLRLISMVLLTLFILFHSFLCILVPVQVAVLLGLQRSRIIRSSSRSRKPPLLWL